jgi:type II secretory pathway pseudopilin PulG
MLEMLVVMSIIAYMMYIIVGAVIGFRDNIIANNAAKEFEVNLREVRRKAINNALSPDGRNISLYRVDISTDNYGVSYILNSGSLEEGSGEIMAAQYSGIEIIPCNGPDGQPVEKVDFYTVYGEIDILNDSGTVDECEIIFRYGSSESKVKINSLSRTIRRYG